MNISVCMIVKNEALFISKCLNSVKEILKTEDLIVADTGSNDGTKQLAAACGAKVFDFAWNDDFSAARNFSAEKACNDWIFFLDADEVVVSADVAALADFIRHESAPGSIKLIEMTDQSSENLLRLYNKKLYHFEGTIHEQLRPIQPNGQALRPMEEWSAAASEIPVKMRHYGKMFRSKEAGDKKYHYYIDLLLKALEQKPNDPYLLCQLGKVYAFFPEHMLDSCACFEKVFNANPNLKLSYIFNAFIRYGYSLINTRQYEASLALVTQYEDYYAGYDEFRFLVAQCLQNNGKLVEAVEFYESCLNPDAQDAKGINSFLSFYNIGVILEAIDMREDAIAMYLNCGDYEPAQARLNILRR